PPITDAEPAFSPDGTKIAFNSYRDGNYEIYVMNSDGTNQTRLTSDAAKDWYPTWSSDGTKIYFDSQRTGHDEIFQMNADGSNVIQITNTSIGTNECPNCGKLGQLARPNNLTINRGGLIAGGLADVLYAEGSKLTLRPGPIFANSQYPIEIVLD